MSDQNSENLGGNRACGAISGSEVGREGLGGGMTSGGSVVWGSAIAVDGKRPGFVRDEDRLRWYWRSGEGPDWSSGSPFVDAGRIKVWANIGRIELPADHPHYRQPAPIDWSGELEAVHEDGRVVAVRLSGFDQPDHDGDYSLSEFLDTRRSAGKYFKADGSQSYGYADGGRPWRIRNVTPQPTPEVSEIPDGMKPWHGGQKPTDWSGKAVMFRNGEVRYAPAGVIWKMGWDHSYGMGDIVAYSVDAPQADTKPDLTARMEAFVRAVAEDGGTPHSFEAGRIVALLPEPVDPDLIEAREIAADMLKVSQGGQFVEETRNGGRDGFVHVCIARAALARGRALALAGEKEA